MTIQQAIETANQHYQSGRWAEAEALYRQILAVEPCHADAFHMLGVIAAQMGRNDLAVDLIGRAIALRPDFPDSHNNLGNALYVMGQRDGAIAAYRQAISLRPDYPEAHSNLGNALKDKGQLDEAIAAYRQAIALRPDFPEAHSNLGIALKDKGQFDEAIAACRQAISLKPNSPGGHYNLALVLLVQGDLISGWEEHEWRWQLKGGGSPQRNFTQPQWDGSPLAGRTILLHAEQGLGDTLQSVRYAPLVAQRGGRVIVECQPGLERLLETVEGITQIVTWGEPLPAFDVHCPLMSLPLAFGTRLETIPATIPYLQADAQKAARWQERLNLEESAPGEPDRWRDKALKVGLVWAGASRPHQPSANRIDRRRSMSLSQFAPLAGLPGVVFISLQKGAPAEEARTPPSGMRLLDWTAELHDFAETAALVESLDLVISVDTAVVHLAGALGKPVWVLSRFDNCWRWLHDRADSPWYPTARLFRQPQPMEWEPVIAEVREQLRMLVQSRTEKP